MSSWEPKSTPETVSCPFGCDFALLDNCPILSSHERFHRCLIFLCVFSESDSKHLQPKLAVHALLVRCSRMEDGTQSGIFNRTMTGVTIKICCIKLTQCGTSNSCIIVEISQCVLSFRDTPNI
ncbi:hypothetical protein ILYODFUR_024007 [Ilyodon furcidens]|uniref:Uncharacterized protein n=1 Tax=Ilyodon furcidens TaxID=33524 RepID=A0ABV0V5M0_9TELE